ncbi:MAG: oxidoreductase [Magnetovibrio sp.]|nr:oxidoreductase [Magnetovibrio sp.]
MNDVTKKNLSQQQYPSHARRLQVRQVTYQAIGINSYELVSPKGEELPPFTAGSHIDFYFRDGSVRQYSLCNDPKERHRYLIAVLREAESRGGSEGLHERVHVQRTVCVGEVRNNFPLSSEAKHHLFLAGGIGVTPMMAMIGETETNGETFTMHYCSKSPEHTAFRPELEQYISAGKVILHHDGGDPSQGLDIVNLLATQENGTHVYYCGPPGFMRAVKRATKHWESGTVHAEHFSSAASPKVKQTAAERKAVGDSGVGIGFQVMLASNGATYFVANDKSIADVLKENGVHVETSCNSGLCGTCKTRYIEGEVDHNDLIMDADEQAQYLTLCCSRAKGKKLVIDL